MTRAHLFLFLKILIFSLLFLLFCGFESSFWPFVAGSIPAPQLWLITMIFVGLKWPFVRAILFCYFLGLLMTSFTYLPLKMVWVNILGLVSFIWFFKNRFFSSSIFFFSILVSTGSIFYYISFVLTSYWLEPHPTSFNFLDRFLLVCCNFLFSVPVFKFLDSIDQLVYSEDSWGGSPAQNSIGETDA